tara:strand:+ start:51 stop:170 length:120 start_codon:yes stop_codon:yes gene_type:complete
MKYDDPKDGIHGCIPQSGYTNIAQQGIAKLSLEAANIVV